MREDEFFKMIRKGFSPLPDYSSLIREGSSNLDKKDPWNFRDTIIAAKYLQKSDKNSK